MKTFTKHILLLALMLFGVAGAAWATRAPQKFTGPVDIDNLVVGDTLAPGFSLICNGESKLRFPEGTVKINGSPREWDLYLDCSSINNFTYGSNGAMLLGSDAVTPAYGDWQDGNAWVVTDAYFDEFEQYYQVTLGGITIDLAPDPTVPALDELTGNWNFLMPGSNKVVKVTYKAQPGLAWVSGNDTLNRDTLNLYRGFDSPFFAGLQLRMNPAFAAHFGGDVTHLDIPTTWAGQETLITPSDLPGFQPMTEAEAKAWTGVPATGNGWLLYAYNADNSQWTYLLYESGSFDNEPYTYTMQRGDVYDLHVGYGTEYYYTTAGSATLRYGSSDPRVVTIDANGHAQAVGAGTATLYAVFDGDDDYQDDSAFFTVTIAEPATLTLAKEGNGTVSALLGGGSATWTTETWANLPSDQNLSPLTFGDITISTTGSLAKYSSYNPGKLSFFVRKHDDAETLTFSSEGGNFSRIEMTMVSEYSQYNPDIIPLDGWTIAGHTAVWEGDAPSVTVTSCSTYVSQITFTRGIDSIVATATEGQYLVIPGAKVQVVATAVDGAHVQGWNEIDKAVTNLLSDTATIVVNQSQTLTANFAQNPVLTLAVNDANMGTVKIAESVDTVYNISFHHPNSPGDNRSITVSSLPYDTTFSYGSAEDLDASVNEPSGKLSIIDQGEHTVTIRISGAFEGYGEYVGWINYGESYDKWHISCKDSIVPVIPDGIAATETENSYLVLPGTEVNVTATPDSAHYLSRIDGHDTVSNYACGYSFVMPDSDYPLMADFTTKPTLTLAQTDGGTLEAIVGNTLAITEIPSSIAEEWAIDNVYLGPSDMPGFESIPEEDAMAWTGVPSEGIAKLLYRYDAGEIYMCVWENGVYSGTDVLYSEKPEYAQMLNMDQRLFYTTGGGAGNVIASSTPNTYYIDYGTPVTVVATPDAQHYLVSFSDDDHDTNSNIAVEKTYDSVIADIPLTANFQAKPTLTLTANDGGTLTLDGIVPQGGESDGNDLLGTFTGSSTTIDGIATLNPNGAEYDANTGWGIYTNNTEMTVTIAEGVNVTKVKFIGDGGSYYEDTEAPYQVTLYQGYAGFTNAPNQDVASIEVYGVPAAGSGLPEGVVSANATLDTFVVDYGTTLTVTATPDSIHYLATLGGVTMGSNTAKDTTFALTATTNLEATFAQKPTLTLAHNQGGEMEVIPAAGGVTAIVPPTDKIALWENIFGGSLAENDMPAELGFVAVDQAAAEAWTGVPASGDITLIYDIDGENFYYLSFYNGSLAENSWANFNPATFYSMASQGTLYITTGVTSNVTATAEPNTYYIDYNTDVTVKATPSDTAYLVRFDNDADTNSNTAVEKTYGPLTAALTTAEATFNDKPVLTLAQDRALVSDDPDAWGTLTLGGDDLPAGVAQIDSVTYRVDYGTTVTVQADATELHHVKNWVDADSAAYPADSITYSDYAITTPQNLFPAHSTLRLTVTADTVTKTIFGINSYDVFARVDTTEDVRGTVRAEYIDIDGVSQSVAADDTVTYTAQGGSLSLVIATPTEPGYHFERWTDTLGAELGTNDTLEVTEAAAVIAVFDTNVYQISGTVAEGSEEWGEVTGSGDYRHFTQATLEALPIEHYHFVKWEDGNTENPRVIDVVGPESHQAEFAIDRFIVSWSSNDEAMGHVVGPYDNHTTGAPIPRLRGSWGTTFQLVAQPAEHHMLDYWSSGQTTDIIQHTITENAELVAYFKHVPYIVTVLSEDETMGTVAGTDTLEWQESTEISATANYGYHFTMWNDSVTDNPRTVVNNIESDQTFTASFAKNEYTVTVVSADETMGSVAGTDTVEYLDEIEISATANEHYHFVQWNDGETANPRTVSVTKNETYTATFAPNVYTLTLGSNNAIMGTVALTAPAVTPNADGSYSIAYGTAVTVQGSASSRCFELGSWSDGAVVTADGSHSFSMAGNLVLTATFVNHLFRSDTVADVCDRFVWHGIAYTETPDVAPLHRLTTVDGCDSALVLNLTVRHSSTGVDEQVHCTPYTWIDGVTYSESNHTAQYILPGANAEQCDSIVTLDLTIGTQAESTEVVNACDSYEWHGVVYTETPAEAPIYTYHTLEGCDSTVTLQLTIGHPTEGIETIVACAPIEWHGTVYSESTDEPTWHTTNAAGCDSTVTLHLTIAPAIETEETVEACDEYEWHGVVYTETPAEAPTYTTVSVQGCDSTVTLHLTVNHSTAAVETVVACNSYEWHGVSYASSTTVPTYTTTGSNGCDSTTTLHLTINHSTSAVETVEACDSYEWHGTTYTASTSLPTYTTEGSNGCDSTTTLNLTIKQSSRATETVVTCDEYEWHGVLFTETPVEAPTYTTEGSNGCDSTVTLNLTVNHSADVVETIGACAAIEWHGTVYSESTTEPTWHSTTVAGCDSTVTLHLTISDRIETEETVVACDSYEWHGVVYTASTDNATWSATSIQGCDSTVTLHLTINRSTTGSETIEACESYEWHGVTYRQSGSYTFDTLNVAGCDSTVTLTLTLHQPTSGSEFVTTCGSYVWHEVTYTQSGAYVWHGTDVHGCDSTVTLLLTILQPVYSTENRTACNSYTWHGTEYSESGDYTWSTTAVSGCDSIVTLHLTINLPVTSDVEESACERYTWNGIVYSTSGDYVQTFTGVNGCDSTVTLHLTVNMPATETLGVTACDSYEWHEVTYTESGVYSWHGTTVAGCDSTATLNLTIGHSADTTISLQGEGSIVWNGETFTQSGTYERVIRTVLGCDSTVTLNLVILPEGFVMPYLYNIMDVVLTINHFQQGETNLQYHWYRWYRNGKMVAEGRAMDTYSEGGSKLNGVYYLEVAIDESLEYWVRSNEVTIGTVGIDEAEDIDFTVAPNPVMHGSTVSVAVEGADVQGAVISVYDVQGREVLRQQNSAFIEAPAASGMYMVRLTLNDGRTAVKRLIVK